MSGFAACSNSAALSSLRTSPASEVGATGTRRQEGVLITYRSAAVTGGAIFAALEEVFGIQFCFTKAEAGESQADILVADRSGEKEGIQLAGSSLEMGASMPSSSQRDLTQLDVSFSGDPDVPFPFRSRSLRTKATRIPRSLVPKPGEKILATTNNLPVWLCSAEGTVKRYRSALPVPSLSPGESLCQVFNGERFLELLPLIQWLRELRPVGGSEGPPLRASFIFDDPNLHWPRYGFVDYRQVAAHASRHNYHAGFATIPLDAWFTHKPTAGLFRNNSDRLSLLVHGNNHIKEELAQPYTEGERVFLLQQALQRIEHLERVSGCNVCRVMVPPHGACSEDMLAEMPRTGFESACISHGSLKAHNRGAAWTPNLGILQSETIRACPVLPRWGMNGDLFNTILVAAYCRQAIIIRGHHQDLKGGIEKLDKIAGFINALGTVAWGDMTKVARQNYERVMDRSNYRIRPLGWKLEVQLPEAAQSMTIESPACTAWDRWILRSSRGVAVEARVGEAVSVVDTADRHWSIEALTQSVEQERPRKGVPLVAVARRLLTESRDRLWI